MNLGNMVTGTRKNVTNIIYSVQKMTFINLFIVKVKGIFRSFVVKVD